MPDKFAFIDTNIFLHYRPFDEVDWLEVLGAKSAALVLAPITISELNEKKDEPSPRLRQRAASVLKKLEALCAKEPPFQIRPGIELVLQDVEPSIDYAANQLDYRSQDDRLLASVLHFKATNAVTQPILIAADFGLRVKARRHGIETTCLPDELRLPEEPDPNEKRIQQLERELLELKRVMPQLELTFEDGTERLEVSLDQPIITSPDEIERERTLVRMKYKKIGEETESGSSGPVLSLAQLVADLSRPSKEAIERHNVELERFYQNYDAWLATRAANLNRGRRSVCLSFILANRGTAPAEDIDVFLHFPDGFELYDERSLPRIPDEPQPPQRPVGGLAGLLAPYSPGLSLDSLRLPAMGPRNVSGPTIRRTNSYDVNIHVMQLKHNLVQSLGSVYLVYESYEGADSFGIDYQMVAANLPKPTAGKLHVIIRKDASRSGA